MSPSRVLFGLAIFLAFPPLMSLLFEGGDAALSASWYIGPAAVLVACGILVSRRGCRRGVGRVGLLVALLVTAVVGLVSWKLMIDHARTRTRAEPPIDRLIQEHNAALPADSVLRIGPGSTGGGIASFVGTLYCAVGFGMLLMVALGGGGGSGAPAQEPAPIQRP